MRMSGVCCVALLLLSGVAMAQAPAAGRQMQNSALGVVQFSAHASFLEAPPRLYTPVQPDIAQIRQEFPLGLFPNVGSGLAFKGRSGNAVDFYGVTDRGPNTDAPSKISNPSGSASKVFPVPGYEPGFGTIRVDAAGARLLNFIPLRWADGRKVSGLPPQAKSTEAVEVPLTAQFRFDAATSQFDPDGLDPEAIVFDARRKTLWISDEYGPWLLRVDPSTGVIRQRIGPGSGSTDFPAVLAERRSNRGMENLTLDVTTQRLVGALQSPIDPQDSTGRPLQAAPPGGKPIDIKYAARFIRWVEFDPQTGHSRSYAYPVDGSLYDKGRTGAAKLGDIVSLGSGRYLAIEQGNRAADGKVQHWLMLVQVPVDATDISRHGHDLEISSITEAKVGDSDWSAVVPLRKTRLLDLDAAGWTAEKAEGLALVDANTLALINDNDYGIASQLLDAQGLPVAGNIEDCTLDAATGRVYQCQAASAVAAKVVPRKGDEHRVQLWMIRFQRRLDSWQLP